MTSPPRTKAATLRPSGPRADRRSRTKLLGRVSIRHLLHVLSTTIKLCNILSVFLDFASTAAIAVFLRTRRSYPPADVFATLQRILENSVSRIVLSAAIIISLVPHDWLGIDDAWFIALFGPEVIARAVLAFRKESRPVLPGRKLEIGWRAPTSNELWLLALDLIAVLSFLPVVASAFVSARWLRLFRLSRTILLLRYWAPVVNDLWTVTRRPERRRQIVFIFGTLIIICFAGAVMLDHVTTDVGDDFDGDGVVGDPHDHEFLVRMWWAFRQLEDPGNLLASPHDAGTLVVSVLLTLAGLFVISFIIGMGTDVVMDLSDLSRMRSPGLRGHTVIVNATTHSRRLLRELLHRGVQVAPGFARAGGPSLADPGMAKHSHQQDLRGGGAQRGPARLFA